MKMLGADGNKVDISAFERLVSRSRRTGTASDQIALSPESTLAVTASALPSDGGVVLVIEDLSELIAAQRAHAWQEVARRMAHEIKNPLTPIQLSAERIAKRFERTGHRDNGGGKRIDDKGPMSDVIHESTDTILREVTSLKSMVDEFSRFARLPEARLERGNLNEAIDQAIATCQGKFGGIDLVFSNGAQLPEIMLDGEQLKRVFINLIENSAEALEDKTNQPRIEITTRHDAARDIVVAEVSDNGRGFAPGDLQKLFQPYFSTKGRGTGLGLAIVQRIISEHHGRIHAVKNLPRGARFIVELPVNL
jgi:nitrogen fixation/metabolism regulation signal transduction histidine kinase